MTGDEQPSEQRPREHRHSDRQGNTRDEPDGGNEKRNRNRRSGGSGGGGGGGRRAAYRFEDQMEHDICQLVTHRAPKGFPVIGRPELATMPSREVTRTETRILYCNHLHEGPHIWPNGDEVQESTT